MADSRITALDENTSPIVTDLIEIVDDAVGTPVSQKVTVANLLKVANRYFTFTVAGTLSTDTGVMRIYNLTGSALTVNEVHAAVNSDPSGAAIIIDVNIDGTTVFTTQGNRTEIAIAGYTATQTTIENASWADNSYVTMDVDQIGSGDAGSDLTVTVVAS